MTFFPVEKPCDSCGREFLAAIPGQTTCTTCLTAPSRKNGVVSDQTTKSKGEDMPQDCKEKICVDCKKPFKPTSNVQKRCVPCGENYKPERKKNSVKPSSKTTTESPPLVISDSEDAMVLRMLVAADLVTNDKIQDVREIIRKLKA